MAGWFFFFSCDELMELMVFDMNFIACFSTIKGALMKLDTSTMSIWVVFN